MMPAMRPTISIDFETKSRMLANLPPSRSFDSTLFCSVTNRFFASAENDNVPREASPDATRSRFGRLVHALVKLREVYPHQVIQDR